MKKPTSIHELLQMTKEDYENHYTETYLRWCLNYAKGTDDLQKLVANRSVANYFETEMRKLQLKFIASAQNLFGTVDHLVIRNLYGSITAAMFQRFPISLFESARKLSIINQN